MSQQIWTVFVRQRDPEMLAAPPADMTAEMVGPTSFGTGVAHTHTTG